MDVADCLKTKDMITDEMYSKVHAAEQQHKEMRILLDVLV